MLRHPVSLKQLKDRCLNTIVDQSPRYLNSYKDHNFLAVGDFSSIKLPVSFTESKFSLSEEDKRLDSAGGRLPRGKQSLKNFTLWLLLFFLTEKAFVKEHSSCLLDTSNMFIVFFTCFIKNALPILPPCVHIPWLCLFFFTSPNSCH